MNRQGRQRTNWRGGGGFWRNIRALPCIFNMPGSLAVCFPKMRKAPSDHLVDTAKTLSYSRPNPAGLRGALTPDRHIQKISFWDRLASQGPGVLARFFRINRNFARALSWCLMQSWISNCCMMDCPLCRREAAFLQRRNRHAGWRENIAGQHLTRRHMTTGELMGSFMEFFPDAGWCGKWPFFREAYGPLAGWLLALGLAGSALAGGRGYEWFARNGWGLVEGWDVRGQRKLRGGRPEVAFMIPNHRQYFV